MNLFKFVAIFCASELMIVFAYPVTNDEPGTSNSPADKHSTVENPQPETGEPSTVKPEKKSWADWAEETSSSDPDEPTGEEPSLSIDELRGGVLPLKTIEHAVIKKPTQRQANEPIRQKTLIPWKASGPSTRTSDGILGTSPRSPRSPRKMVVLGSIRSKETQYPRSRKEEITFPNKPLEDQISNTSYNLNISPRKMAWVSFKGDNAPENSPVEQVREQEMRQVSYSPPSTQKLSWADIAKGVNPNITQIPDQRNEEAPQLDTAQKPTQSPTPAEISSLRPHTEEGIRENIQSPTPAQILTRGPVTEIAQKDTQSPKPIEQLIPTSIMETNEEVPSLTEMVQQNIDKPTTKTPQKLSWADWADMEDSGSDIGPRPTEKVPVEEAKESEKLQQNIDKPTTEATQKVSWADLAEMKDLDSDSGPNPTEKVPVDEEAKESEKVQQYIDKPATESPQKVSWADWAEMEGSDSDLDYLDELAQKMAVSPTAEQTVPQAKAESIETKQAKEPPKNQWSAGPPSILASRSLQADLTRGKSLGRTAWNTSTKERQYPDMIKSNVKHTSYPPRRTLPPQQYGMQVNVPSPMTAGKSQQSFDKIINQPTGRLAQHISGQREVQPGIGRPSKTAAPPNFSSTSWARIVNPNFYPVQPPAVVPFQRRPAEQTLPQPEMENRRSIDVSGTSTIKKLLGIGTTAGAENSGTQSTRQESTTPVSSPMENRPVADLTAQENVPSDSVASTTPSKKSAYVPPFRRATKDGSSSAENSPMKRPGEQGTMTWDAHEPSTTIRAEETKVDIVKDTSFETKNSDEQKKDRQLSETIELAIERTPPLEEGGPVEQNIAAEDMQSEANRSTTPIEKLVHSDTAEAESSSLEIEPNVEQSSQSTEGNDLQKNMQAEVKVEVEVDRSPTTPGTPFSENVESTSQHAETIPLEQSENKSLTFPDIPSPENAEPELQHPEAEPEQNKNEEVQRHDSGRFLTIGAFKLLLVGDEEESSALDYGEPPIIEPRSETIPEAAKDKLEESFNIQESIQPITDRLPTEVMNLTLDSGPPTSPETPENDIQSTTPPTSLQIGDLEQGSQPPTIGTDEIDQQIPLPASSKIDTGEHPEMEMIKPTVPKPSPSQIETVEQIIQETSSPKTISDVNGISKSVLFKIDDSTQSSPATPVKAKGSPLASNANFHGAKIVPVKTFRDIVTGHTEEPQRISRTLRKRNKQKSKRKERKLKSPKTPEEDSSQGGSDEYQSASDIMDSPQTPASLMDDEDKIIDLKTETLEPVQELETKTPPAPPQEDIEDSVPDSKVESPASIKEEDSVVSSKTRIPASVLVDEEIIDLTDSKIDEEPEEVAKPPDPPPDILVKLPDSNLSLKCPSKEIANDLESCLPEFKEFYDESAKSSSQVVILRNITSDIDKRKLNFKIIGKYGDKPAEIQMVNSSSGQAKHALIRVGDSLLKEMENSPDLQFLKNLYSIDFCPVIELADEVTQSEPEEKTRQENFKAQEVIPPLKKPLPSQKPSHPSILQLSEPSPPDSPGESSPTKSARRKMRAKKKKEAFAELFAQARFGPVAESETKAKGSSSKNTNKEKKGTPTPQPPKASQPKGTIQSKTSVKLKETPQPQGASKSSDISSSSQNIQRTWPQPIPQAADKSLSQRSQQPQHRLLPPPHGSPQLANESLQQKNLKNKETSPVQDRLKSPEKVQSVPLHSKPQLEETSQSNLKREQSPQTRDESNLQKISQSEQILPHASIQFGNINLQHEGSQSALEVQIQETQQSETIQKPTEEVETPQSAKTSPPNSSEEAPAPIEMSRAARKRLRQRKNKEEFEELMADITFTDSKLTSRDKADEPNLNTGGEEAEIPRDHDPESNVDEIGEAPPPQNVDVPGQDETNPPDQHELTIGKHKLLSRPNNEGDDVTAILEADILVRLPDSTLFLKCPSKDVADDLRNCITEFKKLYDESVKSSAHVAIIRDVPSDLNDRKLKFKIIDKYGDKPIELKITSSSGSQKKYALIQVNELLLEKMKNSPHLQFPRNECTIEFYTVIDRAGELASAEPDKSGTSTPDGGEPSTPEESSLNTETRKVDRRKTKKENILLSVPSAPDPLSNANAVRRWRSEVAKWGSIGQMLDDKSAEGLSKSERLIVLPKIPGDDVFTELQNFIPYPRKYGVKRTVLFASNVAIVDCESPAEAIVLGEALKKSEKLLVYPAMTLVNEVWIHSLPLNITLDEIAKSIRQKYRRGPLHVQLLPYKTKPKERLARLTVTETLLREIRADPVIQIEWKNGEFTRPIQVQHCENCWLFGHRSEMCPLPTLPQDMRI